MGRLLRVAFIAAAALFAQHAAQLHAFSHLERELGHAEAGGATAPPAEQHDGECLAFHTLGSGLPGLLGVPGLAPPAAAFAAALRVVPAPRAPRRQFLSRAPPAHS